MIRKIYQELFPLSLRTALGQSRDKIRQWWWRASMRFLFIFQKIWWRHIRKKVSTPEWRTLLHGKHEKILAEARPLNVVFEVTGISKWKADSVLRLMMGLPRFNPIVWHVPYTAGGKGTERDRRELEQCRVYFSTVGAKLVDYAALAEFPEGGKGQMSSFPMSRTIFRHMQRSTTRGY